MADKEIISHEDCGYDGSPQRIRETASQHTTQHAK
jgi:hypothetical protein